MTFGLLDVTIHIEIVGIKFGGGYEGIDKGEICLAANVGLGN